MADASTRGRIPAQPGHLPGRLFATVRETILLRIVCIWSAILAVYYMNLAVQAVYAVCSHDPETVMHTYPRLTLFIRHYTLIYSFL